MIKKEDLKIGMTVFFYKTESKVKYPEHMRKEYGASDNINRFEIYSSNIKNVIDYHGAISIGLENFECYFSSYELFEKFIDCKADCMKSISSYIDLEQQEIKELKDKMSKCFKQEEVDLKSIY